MWVCPKCGESLHDYEESCWNCRVKDAAAAQGEPGQAAGASPAAVREPMKKCPYCAEVIRLEAIKCRYCGSEMPEVRHAPERKGQNRILIAALIMATVIAVILAAVLAYKPLYTMVSSGGKGPDAAGVKGVAYEEILEYDGKGNVKKTLKTYPQEKGKNK